MNLSQIKNMKPASSLKVASVFLGIIILGHMFAHFFAGSRGIREDALTAAMKNYSFPVMGFSRTHWDFYQGYSLFLILGLLTQAAILWKLSGLVGKNSTANSFVFIHLMSVTVMAVLFWIYFFTAPALCATLAAACLAQAHVKLQKHS